MSRDEVDIGGLISHLLDVPEAIGKLIFSSNHETLDGSKGAIPVDILETEKELMIYMDVPGLSKSDIQVTLEEEKMLVVKSSGKRKREEEEECRYLRLERKPFRKLMRKFRLPENCNTSGVTARCVNGVLSVVVEKLPPPSKSKSKTVEVAIS